MKPGSFDSRERAEWVILDARGNLVARQPVQDTGAPVDLRSLGLASGTYLVRMETKHYQTKFQQIVFNN
jgi:hypothetical protein